jgi:hypothetical protein
VLGRLSLGPAAAAILAAAAIAQAAAPKPGARYVVHDHQTPRDNWHVEAKVNRAGTKISGLVISGERCGEFTPYAARVPIDADGRVQASGPLDAGDPARGSFTFDATFVASHQLDGSFRFVTPDCDTGAMLFSAHSGGHDHSHQHGRTNMSGTPIGEMPDLSKAKPRRLAQARRLYRESHWAAERNYPTYRAALRAGFRRYSTADKRPQLFHMRSSRYAYDDVWFLARKVESLVYYRPSVGRPVLVAFMFRAPVGGQPKFAKPILGWHSHGKGDPRRLQTQMTHVWLTNDLRSALANCMPVAQLEAALPRFRLEPGTLGLGHESSPCPPDA